MANMGRMEYRPDDDLLFVNNLAHTRFDNAKAIDRAFAEIEQYWENHCKRRVYCIVDYTNLVIEPNLLSYWSEKRTAAVRKYTYTTVRYGADLGTRVALRAMAIKTHVPSNLYATKEEAIAVVRGIRQGTIRFEDTG